MLAELLPSGLPVRSRMAGEGASLSASHGVASQTVELIVLSVRGVGQSGRGRLSCC